MQESDNEPDVLRPNAFDVVHIVYVDGSSRRAICASWNQNITGNGLVWGTPCPTDYPTCVYCIYYRAKSLAILRRVKAHP
jgi:hypothetical protein